MPEPDPKAIFQEAQELPAAERGGFLDRSCGGDPAVRARVEALLAAERAEGNVPADSRLSQIADLTIAAEAARALDARR